MSRRISIRVKLAVALAVPLVGLVATSAFEVRQAAREAERVRQETRLARAANGPAGLITRMQDERQWAVTELFGLAADFQGPIAGYEPTRAATDEALVAFRAEVEEEGGVVQASYRDALNGLDELAVIRRDIDTDPGPSSVANLEFSSDVFDRYSVLIEQLLRANSSIAEQVEDPHLRRGVELANVATEQAELEQTLSREVLVTASLSPGGIDRPDEIAAIAGRLVTFNTNNRVIENSGDRYAAVIRDHHPAGLAEVLPRMTEDALAGTVGAAELTTAWVDGLEQHRGGGYQGLRDPIVAVVSERADELNDSATTRRRNFTVVAVVVVLLASGATLLVARSIIGPLRSLTRQAKEIAGHRLPEAVLGVLDRPLGEDADPPELQPVQVRTRDEVGDVARALNTVQMSAFDLAIEQAVLRHNIADSFVSLGRRNQNLLSRQLDFITELETGEPDPDVLASLFRLDHLATRMRRNAESLLVLAGVAPPRQWSVPVRMGDVVRAALGEVDDFRRVQVEDVQAARVMGSAASDLAHLLAELMENSLAFSPPEEVVSVRGGWLDRERFRLVVIDRGVGMPPESLERANQRLAQSESFTVAPSKYLGHYVAGTLAARHGIHVRLEAGPGSGTVAVVDLPPPLVSDEAMVAGGGYAPGVGVAGAGLTGR